MYGSTLNGTGIANISMRRDVARSIRLILPLTANSLVTSNIISPQIRVFSWMVDHASCPMPAMSLDQCDDLLVPGTTLICQITGPRRAASVVFRLFTIVVTAQSHGEAAGMAFREVSMGGIREVLRVWLVPAGVAVRYGPQERLRRVEGARSAQCLGNDGLMGRSPTQCVRRPGWSCAAWDAGVAGIHYPLTSRPGEKATARAIKQFRAAGELSLCSGTNATLKQLFYESTAETNRCFYGHFDHERIECTGAAHFSA